MTVTRRNVLLGATATAAILPLAARAQASEVVIGLTYPFSGANAQIGVDAQKAYETAAEIINLMGSSVETSALDYIREADNELAQKIMDNMFTFDDLNKLDDKGFQSLLKEVQSESLVIALKGAAPELREKVFRNMSSRAAETLREDLDSRGPVRVSEVESEQKEMLKIVRRLVDEGQIVMASGGADDFL